MNLLALVRASRELRLALAIVGGLAVVGLLGFGGWSWYRAQEARGEAALAEAAQLVQQAEALQAPAEARDKAVKALEAVIAEHPRLSALPQAAYQLGHLRYAAGQYAPARKAYELALAKGAAGSLRTLSALGIGYSWEAEGNYTNAATAYEGLLNGLTPKDFLYEEALMDLARAQEQSGKPAAALETYQRILKQSPQSPRADDVRTRAARLQSRVRP